MSAPKSEITVANAAWEGAKPDLSVLIPFYRYDPTPLALVLDREASGLSGRVELVLLDDGGVDARLAEASAELIADLKTPAQLIRLAANQGRAKGRNRLIAAARAPYLLFLDCDMAPDSTAFLARWLELIDREAPKVAVGGFSLKQATPGPQHRLHAALQQRAECLPAAVRARDPGKYVYTSNLLARREVFDLEPFDEAFNGWGWEDVDFGMRAAARFGFGVSHIDNPASHLGLDTAGALLAKYDQAGPNFARFCAKHAEAAARLPSYRLAKMLKRQPGRALARAALKAAALAEAAPLPLRIVAAKLYRAFVYAEALA
ncbi:MAG: glycosyltransferase family 2 protein [Pseudomonadota bacterium]|jgi:glycosyltransferase involved in cell wall biosynthesis